MRLVAHDYVVEAVAPDRADDALGVAVLPRRSSRGRSISDAHGMDPAPEDFAIGAVVVPDQILWGAGSTEGT
jgi:hypothetical protein